MPDLPAYTRAELEARARNLIRLRLPEADVADGTDYDLWARILGVLAFGMQAQGNVLLRLIDPRRAFGTVLREHADAFGIGRELGASIAAVAATGLIALRSSTASQTQTAGSALTHADGTAYTLDADATTSATAAKVLRSGFRSTRSRIYQGHEGAGFVTAVAGEVYEYDATGEYVAIHGADSADISNQWFLDLHTALTQDPSIHDTLTQQLGAVGAVTCSAGGAVGNKDPGDVLTLSSPAGTVVAEVQILSLSGGYDAMSPALMQSGVRDLLGSRLGAMPMADVLALALQAPGISRISDATLFPALGTYTLYPYQADSPFVTAERSAEVAAYLDARLAIPDKVVAGTLSYRIDGMAAIEVKVQRTVAPDFDLGTTAMTVDPGSTVSRVEIAVAVPAAVQVGDRVIVSGSTAGASKTAPYIVQRTVSAVGAAYIDLDEPLPYPPDDAVSFVTAGGPACQRIIDAVLAHYDAQRADVSSTALSYPVRASTSHTQALTARVADVPDVLDVALNTTAQATPASGEVATMPALIIKVWS